MSTLSEVIWPPEKRMPQSLGRYEPNRIAAPGPGLSRTGPAVPLRHEAVGALRCAGLGHRRERRTRRRLHRSRAAMKCPRRSTGFRGTWLREEESRILRTG